MDDKFKAILDNFPKMHQRSKLEPYTEFIAQRRRRGHTQREIARILAGKCDLIVASSTLVRFVAARSKKKLKCSKHRESRKVPTTVGGSIEKKVTSAAPDDNVRKRIEALKKWPAKSVQPAKQFEYDPNQPLHLVEKTQNN